RGFIRTLVTWASRNKARRYGKEQCSRRSYLRQSLDVRSPRLLSPTEIFSCALKDYSLLSSRKAIKPLFKHLFVIQPEAIRIARAIESQIGYVTRRLQERARIEAKWLTNQTDTRLGFAV